MAKLIICSVEGCENSVECKSLCSKHYQRLKRRGDPLYVWKPATKVVELQAYLSASTNECLIWPGARLSSGYAAIRFENKTQSASRVMCVIAHGEPPTPTYEAAHSCGNGHLACINPRHLFWKTPTENQADKIIHGTTNRGERSASAKLTEEKVKAIRALDGRYSRREIGDMFGVSRQTAKDIILRRRWSWLD